MKSPGGFVWAAKNYDGDVQSDTLAQGKNDRIIGYMKIKCCISTSSTGPSSQAIMQLQVNYQSLGGLWHKKMSK